MAANQKHIEKSAKTNVGTHSTNFLKDHNVVGLAVGHKYANNEDTGETCVTVLVAKKVPKKYLAESQLIPKTLQAGRRQKKILTDVMECGPIYALAVNTIRERPIRPGASIGHINITAGTFGALMTDISTGHPAILSNNHILAASNEANTGDNILQPGPADGGQVPADIVGSLLKFVPLDFAGGDNTVDAALCRLSDQGLINYQPHDIIPAPSSEHPAVGLLFAGSFSHTIINPISAVLDALDVVFPETGAVIEPDIGMHVQKTGRTTGATYGTILNTNATVRVGYPGGHSAIFVNQIITGNISRGGDSGSLVVQGGGGMRGCGRVSDPAEIKSISSYSYEPTPDTWPPDPGWGCGAKMAGKDVGMPPIPHSFASGNESENLTYWHKATNFRDEILAESLGGRRVTRLYYSFIGRINDGVTSIASQVESVKVVADRLTSYSLSAFADPTDPDLELTSQHIDDLTTLFNSLKGELTNREEVFANQLFQLSEEKVGKLAVDILEALDDNEFLERIPTGSPFIGNKRSKEVHDLDQMTNNCQIDKIITAKNAVFFDTGCLQREEALDSIHAEGYDNCHYCIGDSKR